VMLSLCPFVCPKAKLWRFKTPNLIKLIKLKKNTIKPKNVPINRRFQIPRGLGFFLALWI
jgi:hypothetical protein